MREIKKGNIDKEFDSYMQGRQCDGIDDTDKPRFVLNVILPLFLKVRGSNLTEIQKLKYIIIGMQDKYNETCIEEINFRTNLRKKGVEL